MKRNEANLPRIHKLGERGEWIRHFVLETNEMKWMFLDRESDAERLSVEVHMYVYGARVSEMLKKPSF